MRPAQPAMPIFTLMAQLPFLVGAAVHGAGRWPPRQGRRRGRG